MSSKAGASARNEIVILARRLGIDVSESDIDYALGLDDLGRRALRQATDALSPGEEPATPFALPVTHD